MRKQRQPFCKRSVSRHRLHREDRHGRRILHFRSLDRQRKTAVCAGGIGLFQQKKPFAESPLVDQFDI